MLLFPVLFEAATGLPFLYALLPVHKPKNRRQRRKHVGMSLNVRNRRSIESSPSILPCTSIDFIFVSYNVTYHLVTKYLETGFDRIIIMNPEVFDVQFRSLSLVSVTLYHLHTAYPRLVAERLSTSTSIDVDVDVEYNGLIIILVDEFPRFTILAGIVFFFLHTMFRFCNIMRKFKLHAPI